MHEDHKENVGQIGLEAQKHIGPQVVPVAMTNMTEYLQVTGTVQPIDSRIVHVRPLARGRITSVSVRLGDRVRAGQELARMENMDASDAASELISARAELQRLRVLLAAQMRQTDRQRKLSEIGAVPGKEYEGTLAEQQSTEEMIRVQDSRIAGLRAKLGRFGVKDAAVTGTTTTSTQAPFTGVVTKTEALPSRTVLIGRIRKDARLFARPTPEQENHGRSRHRCYGDPLPTPEQYRQSQSLGWKRIRAFAAGSTHTFHVKALLPSAGNKPAASVNTIADCPSRSLSTPQMGAAELSKTRLSHLY